MPNNRDENGDYIVGHGRPPRDHQFPKGQSGNPKGRPKKQPKSYEHAMAEVMRQMLRVQIDGQIKYISTMEAMVKAVVGKALKGDLRSVKSVLEALPKETVSEAVRGNKQELVETLFSLMQGNQKESAEDERMRIKERLIARGLSESEAAELVMEAPSSSKDGVHST